MGAGSRNPPGGDEFRLVGFRSFGATGSEAANMQPALARRLGAETSASLKL